MAREVCHLGVFRQNFYLLVAGNISGFSSGAALRPSCVFGSRSWFFGKKAVEAICNKVFMIFKINYVFFYI